MGKLLQFPPQRDVTLQEAEKIKKMSDKIDTLILTTLDKNELKPHELAGILAHRLGTLMRNMEQKRRIWDVCEQVLKRQAIID